MNRNIVFILSVLVILSLPLTVVKPATAQTIKKKWVTSDKLNRRTCPSTSCGVVGRLFFREAAHVHEVKGGWARVSKYYNASCTSGRSELVDSGDSKCAPKNGIVDGKFAEWVSVLYLSSSRPEDPAKDASGDELLIAQSDDYRIYKKAFLKATRSLIEQDRCTKKDFIDNGGWVKSYTHRTKPIYFTYCNGYNKVYLNTKTGKIN
ncbi:hypothetical protein [Kiloniella antarctica]|uniref:Uncharacterized protein n=1 Tax=Kiloniella antarctica TaxID=1550907 RepID=A0ABW5BKX3_9PROT